ncbi:MAG: dolichyl-phosphate-mannose--protein mannosyltransferase [Prevotella sp.]|nr:dolichyl-phosphate-mannose--protein mannosyltransferase [Prevotella sp.]
MKTSLLWLAIIIAFLPMLIFRDFTPDNEARYLSIADEALGSGHFFSFSLHGEAYADKPPFYLWLVMLSRQLVGHHSMLALSMFSLLPAFGIVKVMNGWTRHSLSSAQRDLATLLLLTTAYFAGAAMVIRMDMLMCLFVVLALRSYWRLFTAPHSLHSEQWLMGLWLFMALFTKGPLGLLIPLVGSLVFTLFKHRLSDFGRLWNWRTWLVIIIGCAAWFYLTYREAGAGYLNNLVFHQTVGRGINSFHHARPFFYYLISIWYEWLPWSLLCVGGMVMVFARRLRLDAEHEFFLCMVLTTLVLLSCISSKLQIYLLPAFPFLIYLTTHILHLCEHERWVSWTLGIPETILVLTFPALLLAPHFVALPLLRLPLVMVATGVLSLFSLASLYWLVSRKSPVVSSQILAYGILATLFMAGWAMPVINPYIVK